MPGKKALSNSTDRVSSLFAILTSSLWLAALITNTLVENWKTRVFTNFRTFTIWASMRVVVGIGQEITTNYRITLADWLSIIQSKTIFMLHKTVISIKQTCYMCTWPWFSPFEPLALFCALCMTFRHICSLAIGINWHFKEPQVHLMKL